MALFFSEKKAKKTTKSTACLTLEIQSLDYQGLGVAKHQGKTYFVENSLPDERVEAKILEEKPRFGRAQAVKILQKSAKRQSPFCPHYGQCGGCQMQHIPLDMQREAKQTALFTRLQRLQSQPIVQMPMIVGNDKGYRRRARLSAAIQNNEFALGFRQAGSNQIIPISQCDVLEPTLSALLEPLQRFFATWKNKKSIGHLELVAADNEIVLLLRHIGALSPQDRDNLQNFAQNHALALFLMNDEGEIRQQCGTSPFYEIQGMPLAFSVRDFIQVNRQLNEKMVQTALNWLDLQPTDRVLDLFCGMGNFTLPIAPQVQQVVGIEGVAEMVQQAQQNAQASGVKNATFYQTDLSAPFANQSWAKQPFNKILLDPARNGAFFALDHLCDLAPEKIVYVSCSPATLVRDAEKLISRGYRIIQSAVIDMFPYTGHLESVTLFEKEA